MMIDYTLPCVINENIAYGTENMTSENNDVCFIFLAFLLHRNMF